MMLARLERGARAKMTSLLDQPAAAAKEAAFRATAPWLKTAPFWKLEQGGWG
jgi:hypothetical protein